MGVRYVLLALFPRLLVPLALASLGLLLSPSVLPEASRGTMRGLGGLTVLGTIVFFALALRSKVRALDRSWHRWYAVDL